MSSRDATEFVPAVKAQVAQLPWSSEALNNINQMRVSMHIRDGFESVRQFQETHDDRGRASVQMDHLMALANHEQGVVLQPLIYQNADFSWWVRVQRNSFINWASPKLELTFVSECRISRRFWLSLYPAALASCCLSSSLSSSKTTPQSGENTTNKVTVKFSELGDEFIKRNPGLVRVNKQPAGLNFYKIDSKPGEWMEILVENSPNSLHIAHALGLSASEDADTMNRADSFQHIWIGASISPQELIPHDEARLLLYDWLQHAAQAGWRPNLFDSDPRLSGKPRFDYALNRDDTIGLDSKYVPTLDEWMRIRGSIHWFLYANHVFLDLSFHRDDKRLDPKRPGAYFLSFDFTTELEYFRSYAGPEHRKDWKQFMPAARIKAHETRKKVEAELRAEGIPIDESYRDPIAPI